MIKTVKVKKQLRLDELIKYVWDNDDLFKCKDQICFEVDGQEGQGFVCFENNAGASFTTSRYIESDETFTVEMEEEITEDTKFIWLVEASDTRIWNQKNASIGDVIDEGTKEIRALINGKLELIWEAK